jgi:hypothetical protein
MECYVKARASGDGKAVVAAAPAPVIAAVATPAPVAPTPVVATAPVPVAAVAPVATSTPPPAAALAVPAGPSLELINATNHTKHPLVFNPSVNGKTCDVCKGKVAPKGYGVSITYQPFPSACHFTVSLICV